MAAVNVPFSLPRDAAFERCLQEGLAAKGPGYQPRTRHKQGDVPRFTNRLILQSSPYLLQHAHNPVDWFPWGDEAFECARRERRPVFLSIGYSTCHWCHVMEEESFEDEAIAAAMNSQFMCIKVDREERPDIDAVYMSAVQNLTGSGGWPMSVWLTADRAPFFAGTYFPPRDGVRGVRRGFLTLLGELRATFDRDPDRVRQAAAALTSAVKGDLESGQAPAGSRSAPNAATIARTVDHFKRSFDPVHGGLRRAPKFPSSLPVRLFLRRHCNAGGAGDPEALEMATTTLSRMGAGGLFDQVGGGFHRYSTDERWLVPHFEKMLYDNGLLAVAYAEAFQITRRPEFARICRETLDYLLREMTSPEGAFYSATDADSAAAHGSRQREEGLFFVWSLAEIENLLGGEAARFTAHYGVTAGGNFEGRNILHVARPDEDTWAALAGARRKLYDARLRRPPPLRDDKILAAWNGLALSGLAVAGRLLPEPRFVAAATRAADFLLRAQRVGGRVLRSCKDGRPSAVGFLEDQAFVVQGLLDLFEAAFQTRHLAAAIEIATTQETLFADPGPAGGWFSSAHDGETLLAREKPAYDGAEPSGSSVAIANALRLHGLTSDDRWRVIAERALGGLAGKLEDRGPALTEALLAVDLLVHPPVEIMIVWPAGARRADAEPLLQVLRAGPTRNFVLAAAGDGDELTALGTLAPFTAGKRCVDGRPTAYVCRQGACERPVTDPSALAKLVAPPSATG